MFFKQYPYMNLNDFNLDYILKTIKSLSEQLENFISLNTIKYANPIQWNITKQYEANTVVIDANDGTAYLSVQAVPTGVAITNTEYWTPIFTLNLLSANQNITFRDDGANVLATFASNVDDWLIWNNTLYKVSRAIAVNEAYVVGYNLTRYSVELFLSDAINAINNVIDVINDIIGDLNDLDTTDKTSIVNAINELFTIASDAENNKTYESAFSIGLDFTGVNDCSSALAALSDNVALKAGTYKIATDCTINAQIVMCGGAVFDIDSGVTLTFNKQIDANPNEQIFSGNGDVVINGYAFPDWFGANRNDSSADCSVAINKAYTSANELRLNGGYYYVTNTVYFNKSGVKVSGIGNGRSLDNPKSQSVIGTVDTSITILTIGNATGLWNGLYENFGVYRTNAGVDGAIGVKIYNTLLSKFNNIFSRSTVSFYCEANVKPTFDKCLAFPRANDISGVFMYGWLFKNDTVNPANNAVGNPSTYILNCTIEGQAPSTAYELGFAWTNGLSDLFIEGLESSYCNRGIQIDADNAAHMHDIRLNKIVIDNYNNFAVRIVNCPDAEVVIDGGYVYGAQVPFLFDNLVGNIIVTHVNAYLSDNNASAVFRLSSCTGVTMKDNICKCNSLLNIASLSSKIISDDKVIIDHAGGVLIYVADGARMKLNLNINGIGTYTYGLNAGNLANSEINVTLASASQIATALARIASTDYNAIGSAGTNIIEGIYA